MILEQRDYRLVPGGAPRYLAAWHKLGRDPQIRHLGEPELAGRVESAVTADLAARTGASRTTAEIGDAIAARVAQN